MQFENSTWKIMHIVLTTGFIWLWGFDSNRCLLQTDFFPSFLWSCQREEHNVRNAKHGEQTPMRSHPNDKCKSPGLSKDQFGREERSKWVDRHNWVPKLWQCINIRQTGKLWCQIRRRWTRISGQWFSENRISNTRSCSERKSQYRLGLDQIQTESDGFWRWTKEVTSGEPQSKDCVKDVVKTSWPN